MIVSSKEILGVTNRKLCIVGLGNIAMCNYVIQGPLELLVELIDGIITLTQTVSTYTAKPKDFVELDDEVEDEKDYGATFVQLKSAVTVVMDPVSEIKNTKEYTMDLMKKIYGVNADVFNKIQSPGSVAFLREM
eukprot:NODE_1_length_95616_cov_0.657642.p70 type:complete len:134 gc:universal NODE_1_length_95616_cov_0.657642:63294-63695(+)